MFSFFGKQISENLLFNATDWNSNCSEYAYTTLIDSIFSKVDDFDKYMSLSNGICFQLHGEDRKCLYLDLPYSNYFNHTKIASSQMLSTSYHHPGETALTVYYTDHQIFDIIACDPCRRYNITPIKDKAKYSFVLNYDKKFIEGMNDFKNCYVTLTSNMEIDIFNLPFLELNINESCPIGFNLSKSGGCVCIDSLQNWGYTCDINTLNISGNSDYWTSLEEYSEFNCYNILISEYYPSGFCKKLDNFTLNDSLANSSCLGNRKGRLCGDCKDGFSAVLGSNACYDHCNNWYLFTVPAYAVAGLILVVLLFALCLTVAKGTINGLIFYANILQLVINKLTENDSAKKLHFFSALISVLNLHNLDYPACLYDGMSPQIKSILYFLAPVYLWSIVFVLVILSRYSIRVANLISNSSVQVLSTLFYLTFSQLILTVINVAMPSELTSIFYNASSHEYSSPSLQLVWFYSGGDYGQGIHGFLLFLAVVFTLFFLLPYSLLVTFSHFFLRFKTVNKFRPFVDAYGGPFKDKWRFWFGLRLWITILLFFISSALRGMDIRTMLIIHLFIVMAFVLIQLWINPFRNCLIGLLDVFFMINYTVIIEIYLLSDPSSKHFINMLFVMSFPIELAFLGIILYHIYSGVQRRFCPNEYENIPGGDDDQDLLHAADVDRNEQS